MVIWTKLRAKKTVSRPRWLPKNQVRTKMESVVKLVVRFNSTSPRLQM